MKIEAHEREPRKCGGCNYETITFYRFEKERMEDELCAQCFVDMLISEQKQGREFKD